MFAFLKSDDSGFLPCRLSSQYFYQVASTMKTKCAQQVGCTPATMTTEPAGETREKFPPSTTHQEGSATAAVSDGLRRRGATTPFTITVTFVAVCNGRPRMTKLCCRVDGIPGYDVLLADTLSTWRDFRSCWSTENSKAAVVESCSSNGA